MNQQSHWQPHSELYLVSMDNNDIYYGRHKSDNLCFSQVHFMATFHSRKNRKCLDAVDWFYFTVVFVGCVTLQAWCDAGIYDCPDYLPILKWHINTMSSALLGQKLTSTNSHCSETSLEVNLEPVVQHHSCHMYLCLIILKFHILSYCCNGYSVWWLTFWNKTKMLTELHKIR